MQALFVGAGGLFLKANAEAPLSDEVIPEPGIYFN